MDLTPPLTRSPASTSKTYSPSEASSSDYPSPGLIEQHYSISSAYEACSSDPALALAPGVSSPRLEAVARPEWSPASVLHPALTTASMGTILSPEYDTFASCDGPLSVSYPSGICPGRSQNSPPPALQRSPVASLARISLQYPPLSASPSPRIRPQDMPSHYSHDMEASPYLSPSLARTPYPADTAPMPHSGPPSSTAHSTNGYASEGTLAHWSAVDHYSADPEQLYSGMGPASPAMMPLKQEPRSAARGGDRRRPPRKLTTKEEANFQCDVDGCGKFFSRSYNFKAHLETHREKREYPFPCQVGDCTKKFVRKTDLQRHHQSVHMKERNHGCEYCGRLFARRDTLKR